MKDTAIDSWTICKVQATFASVRHEGVKASMTRIVLRLITACVVLAPVLSPAQQVAATRGQMLYTTHCISCHTTQMHWRNARVAYDWESLGIQVRRWQDNSALQWTEADIHEVTRYLNDVIYQFPPPYDRVSVHR